MSLAHYQRPLQDEAGNIVTTARIEVRREGVGSALATLYSDREGTTPLANPFNALTGIADFYVIGGAYRVRDLNGSDLDLRYVGIGTGSEIDANAFLSAGWQFQVEGDNTAPPSDGCVRFDDDDLSAATKAWFDYATSAGSDIHSVILDLDPGTKATKNTMILVSQATGEQASWTVDSVTDHTTYLEVALTASSHAGATGFDSSTPVNLQREISGDIAGTGNTITKTTAGDVTIGALDGTLLLKKASPEATGVTLPAVSTRNSLPLHISDPGGNAGDITITPDGSETIQGQANWILGSGGSITLYPSTTISGWYL